MDKLNEQVGENLKAARIGKGLKQEQLAEMAGLSTNHISKLETGKSGLQLKTVIQLCDALDMSIDELVFGETDELLRNKNTFDKAKRHMMAQQLREMIKILEED
ncbi:MAG: helix-turn-helix transcriptional regulator [Firmicutes bacterium]|nr:helix-turn-helix transcriptional regulator [Bacillota bacterium]